ncbi:hypothetical protein RJ55_03239 [Drechmeria coniospora]|nr:hypothetical protein RJ55_03239 [Drechmeria coniospora]
MSYDAGQPVPPTTGVYRAPTFPQPAPSSHQSSYDAHASYPTEAFYSIYPSATATKKKNTRASQACDQCRQLKAKCDETKPCKTCRDKGTECRYRDPVPKATDKAQADILEGITMMQDSLNRLADHVHHMNDRMTKIESSVSMFRGSGHVRPDSGFPEDTKSFCRHSPASIQPEYYTHEIPRDHMSSPPKRLPMQIMVEDEIEAEPGPPVPPGEPAIPINHTTLAGLLLNWVPIQALTRKHVERAGIRHVGEFPISQEQNRGQLIVYGRGEASHPSRQIMEIPDRGPLDTVDDLSDFASPSPAADWGHLGGLSPAETVDYRGGVLGHDGNPDFTESRVWQYVKSFKDNILNMHPIIQPQVLDDWVHHFLDTLPKVQPKSLKHPTSKPTFAVGGGGHDTVGSKRKRSPGLDGQDAPSTPAAVRAGKPERSIHNALILTVLALGKVCLHRDNVPDAVHHGDPLPHGSPMSRNGIPPLIQRSPPSHPSSQSQSSGLPSPNDPERGPQSRRSSTYGTGPVRTGYSLKKNYEVIPGLEYFAFATDILGNHLGSYTNMKNVYANIFAGLYQGQLARPVESFAFIHQAGHKLQVIMRPDLIAELPLPPSGLLSYEDDMPHPNMSLIEGVDQGVLDSYPGQLYLRTHLNSIHRMFYSPHDPSESKEAADNKFKNVGLVADGVSDMTWVAPRYAFREEDPPATEILGARLRGKYWGAQVITYRPFVRAILEFNHNQKIHPASPNFPTTPEFREGIVYPTIAPGTRTSNDLDPKLVELARRGIKALIESTRAFHGLGESRPIITNVFGTAHAQWGNLVVLSAAFRDPVLKSSVDEELLKGLFQRTIRFLAQSSTATSTLRIDMYILQCLQKDLFHTHDVKTNSSFSSQASNASSASVQAVRVPMAVLPHGVHPGGENNFLAAMSRQSQMGIPFAR